MPYYKNAQEKLFWLDDEKFYDSLPKGCEPITDDDAKALLAAKQKAAEDAMANAPKPDAFIDKLKAAMGGIIASNTLARAYPLFYPAVQQQIWPDVEALIIDAHSTAVLSDDQYAAFKQLALDSHLPITLP